MSQKSSTPNSYRLLCQFLPDFQNVVTAKREVNFQQISYSTSHHTFSMLLHYLVEVRSLSFGITGRKCKWKCNKLWFL